LEERRGTSDEQRVINDGYAALRMTPTEFKKQVEEMVGHRIAKVRYHEIAYTDADGVPLAEPEWNWCPDFDSLDHALELTMEDGTVFYLTWGWEFEQYNITVQSAPLHDVSAVRVWDVTESSRWTPQLGQKITAVDTFWSWISMADGSQRTDYPQDIRLTFENGERIYVSAFEARRDGSRFWMMDNVTVFFDDAGAEANKIGPFAPNDGAA
jgi:hypothetical protein